MQRDSSVLKNLSGGSLEPQFAANNLVLEQTNFLVGLSNPTVLVFTETNTFTASDLISAIGTQAFRSIITLFPVVQEGFSASSVLSSLCFFLPSVRGSINVLLLLPGEDIGIQEDSQVYSVAVALE